jgi:hypothetical protein
MILKQLWNHFMHYHSIGRSLSPSLGAQYIIFLFLGSCIPLNKITEENDHNGYHSGANKKVYDDIILGSG